MQRLGTWSVKQDVLYCILFNVFVTPCKVSKAQNAVAACACRARKRALNFGMTFHAARIALAVYVLSDHDSSIAVSFVCKKLRSQLDHDPADIVAWIETRYLDSPLDMLMTLEFPETDVEKRIHAEATKFVSAARTVKYIEHANQDVGVTPSGRQVAEEYIRQCDAVGAVEVGAGLRRALSEVNTTSSGSRYVRKGGRKFRQTWGLGFGQLPVREPMPEEDVRDKAAL